MADLLPGVADVEEAEAEPRVVGLDSEDADEVMAALSAGTARTLFAAVHDDPATPSELAERADTSLQNAQYHLDKLESADLIEARGTRYSEKGREMTVYGPTDRPLVLFAGGDEESEGVRSALRRFLGAVGVLGLASVAVQVALRGVPTVGGGGGDSGAGGGEYTVQTAAETGGEAASGLPPGLLVLLGGLVVLGLAAVRWYVRN